MVLQHFLHYCAFLIVQLLVDVEVFSFALLSVMNEAAKNTFFYKCFGEHAFLSPGYIPRSGTASHGSLHGEQPGPLHRACPSHIPPARVPDSPHPPHTRCWPLFLWSSLGVRWCLPEVGLTLPDGSPWSSSICFSQSCLCVKCPFEPFFHFLLARVVGFLLTGYRPCFISHTCMRGREVSPLPTSSLSAWAAEASVPACSRHCLGGAWPAFP